MMPISSGFNAIARFRELEALNKLDGALYLLTDGAFAFAFGRGAFACKPVWERGGRACGSSVDSINLDVTGICDHCSLRTVS